MHGIRWLQISQDLQAHVCLPLSTVRGQMFVSELKPGADIQTSFNAAVACGKLI